MEADRPRAVADSSSSSDQAGGRARAVPAAQDLSVVATPNKSNAVTPITPGLSGPSTTRAPFSAALKTAGKPLAKVVTPVKASGMAVGKPAATLTSRRPALNVKDALTYLDQVKLRFEKQPEIYNRFLDIMKDFKTQVIDTPGVIDRVSSLFRNHPTLISGFNTFLPLGFRIECSIDPANGGSINSITVITPTGTQHLAAGFASNLTGIKLPGQVQKDDLPIQPQSAAKLAAPLVKTAEAVPGPVEQEPARKIVEPEKRKDADERKTLPSTSMMGLSKAVTASTISRQPAVEIEKANPSPTRQPTPPKQPSRTSTPAAASTLSETRRPPIEFNHAISYVNKIKNRFIRDPDIYKSFLEILQTYQKEQRPIQDVYAQVTRLFKTAPDLLDEFKQFLPDHSQQGQQGSSAAEEAVSQAMQATSSRESETKVKLGQVLPAPKPVGRGRAKLAAPLPAVFTEDVQPAPYAKRKRGPPAESTISTGNVDTGDMSNLQLATSAKQKPGTRSKKSIGGVAGAQDPPSISSVRTNGEAAVVNNGYLQPILSYLPPGYTLPITSIGASEQGPFPAAQETPEESLFFDRVADFIDDKFTYYEFLKLLNLYTQDIVDLPTLVSRAWLFIGSAPEIWADFREIVGWKDGISNGERVIENGEWIVENIPAVDKKGPDLSNCEASGPSYRRLPKSEIQMNCSGRDQLCWEVLNDEWVSVMSLGSEEVFLAHRKNPFEEALHRTEEERHEYDFHIEANLRTIALLEPVAARILTMDPEDRLTFRLKPGLGGQSKSIYQRIIKKVYGKELGREVIQALHENPCTSVPIVLTRLKQKDEEWKRALREWNRVWREVDAKNFYRSLDHQGITFKANDKRYIASKSLVSEIETLRRTEVQKQIALPTRLRPPSQTYQLAFPISDENVLFDALKLFLSYLDRAPGYHTMAERDRIEAFLRSLTSLVFAIPVSVLDAMLTPVQDDNVSASTSDDGDLDGMSDSAASSVDQPLGQPKRTQGLQANGAAAAAKKVADLRKRVLKLAGGDMKRMAEMDGDYTPINSRDSTPNPIAESLPDLSSNRALATGAHGPAEADQMTNTYAVAKDHNYSILERPADGDSSFKKDVPASAAGLDGMQGIETIQTHVDGHHMQLDSEADQQIVAEPSKSRAIQSAGKMLSSGPVIPADTTGPTAGSPIPPPQIPYIGQPNGSSTPILQPAQPSGWPQIRRFNFFCNTPYYCAIRLLHLLYSRLQAMKEAACALGSTVAKDALTNTSYTTFGKANPRFAGQEANTATVVYDGMLELCEKFFGSEIDQAGFEDGIRTLFGNKAYHIFTIDKVLSSLVKTVWSLIDSNREAYSSNGEIFKLLVDDRRYPTTAQAQQISYRINAELAAGSEENLYRVEWMPRRHLLSFQLLGKDEILPEDESDLSKIWERYIQSFLNDEVTKDLAIATADMKRSAYLARTLKMSHARSQPQIFAKSELESRICMRSYRMFWQARTEDAMHRAWDQEVDPGLEKVAARRRQRHQKWIKENEISRLADQQPTDKSREVGLVKAQTMQPQLQPELGSTTLEAKRDALTERDPAPVYVDNINGLNDLEKGKPISSIQLDAGASTENAVPTALKENQIGSAESANTTVEKDGDVAIREP